MSALVLNDDLMRPEDIPLSNLNIKIPLIFFVNKLKSKISGVFYIHDMLHSKIQIDLSPRPLYFTAHFIQFIAHFIQFYGPLYSVLWSLHRCIVVHFHFFFSSPCMHDIDEVCEQIQELASRSTTVSG